MAKIDTLTMYNELISSGATKELANMIVVLMDEMRKELESKIESLTDKLNRR